MTLLHRLLGTSDRSLVRGPAWVLVPAVSIVTVAIAVANLASDPGIRRVFDNIHWTVAYTAAASLAWIGALRAQDADRTARRWLAMALSMYALGQAVWDIQVATGWNPFPGPSDLFFVCLGPLSGIGLLGFLRQGTTAAQRRMIALDVTGLTAALLALTLALYLPKRDDQALLPMAFLVAYPVALCWAASVGIVSALALHLAPRRGWMLFLGALCVNAGLWLRWNSLTLDNALEDGSLLNALFSITALAQGLGALLWRLDISKSAAWERTCEVTLRLFPLLMICISAVAVVLAYTLPHVPEVVRWVALIGGLLVVVLASIRQSILINQHDTLLNAERTLRGTEAAYRVLFDQAADGIFIADEHGTYTDVNARGAEMLGMTHADVLRVGISGIVAAGQEQKLGPELDTLRRGATVSSNWVMQRKDGSTFPAEVSAKMLADRRLIGLVRDISERRALEAQLRQAQKMEAIGTLAAGIAHDFNNLITAISGNAELAALDAGPTHPATTSLNEIRTASARAAELVKQIMAFSRPRMSAAEAVQLPQLVDEVLRLLRSTLPAGIELRATCEAGIRPVTADPSQLHQVLVNLATNAWQAMEGRPGLISVAVEQQALPPTNPLGLPEGSYACVAVTDTGSGIDERTRERIFEPFFTTKPVGEGNGLGLATVHNIVRSYRGAIAVESTKGEGTTFRVYLPAAEHVPSNAIDAAATPQRDAPQSARVLYIDDESALVSLMTRQLDRAGYRMQGFTSSEQALTAIKRAPTSFDVIVTDLNMPKLSGLDLLAAARAVRPDAPFVLTSGYVDSALEERLQSLGVKVVLQKPFTFDELQSAIDRACSAARTPQRVLPSSQLNG